MAISINHVTNAITSNSGDITVNGVVPGTGGGSTLYFPFYKQDGGSTVSDTINLVSGTALPFFNAAGSSKNIALIA